MNHRTTLSLLLLVLTAFVGSTSARAQTVTGTISAGADCHLVIPTGQTDSARVTWNTTPAAPVLITFEINGGALNIHDFDTDGTGYWDAGNLVCDSVYVFKSWHFNGM